MIDAAKSAADGNQDQKKRGTSGLRIDLNVPSSRTGLNIP